MSVAIQFQEAVVASIGRTMTEPRRRWRRTVCLLTSCPVVPESAQCQVLAGLVSRSSRQRHHLPTTTSTTTITTVPRRSLARHRHSPSPLPVTGVTWSITRTSGRRPQLAIAAPSRRQVSLAGVQRAATTSLHLLTRKTGCTRDLPRSFLLIYSIDCGLHLINQRWHHVAAAAVTNDVLAVSMSLFSFLSTCLFLS